MVDWKKNLRIESISNILRTKALCWSWYARIGVSDFPDGPTVNLVAAYLNAIDKATLAPICQRKKVVTSHVQKNAMPLTTQPLAMQILPLNSWSAMAKNRARPPCLMVDTNLPSSVMSLYLFKRFTLGTLTLSKESWNLKMNENTKKP